MQTKINQNPLLWLLLLLTAWACLGAPDWGQKTASGQNSWLESASGEMTGREAAPRLGFGGLVENWASGALVAAKETGILANAARGRASEARVLEELGLTKNTRAVSTAEGRAIPDALTDSLSVEIKDAASVSRTSQVRIQTDAARASGRESILITGEKTCVSGPCARAFDQVIRRSDLGPQ